MAKLLLILPPWSILQGHGYNELPSGLCYLSGYLNRRGHEALVYNSDFYPASAGSFKSIYDSYQSYKDELQNLRHPIWASISNYIKKIQPDIVGIHFKTGAFESVRQVACIARQAVPNCMIVVGGPHPSIVPEEVAVMSEFDIVIRCEGEETIYEVANRYPFNFKDKIPGAIFQDPQGNLVDGGYRPLIKNLDDLGEPDREHIIEHNKFSKNAFGVMFSSRGCPFSCTYCTSKKIWTQKVRYRLPESFVSEIQHVHERYGVDFFNIRDDTFTLNRERTMEICYLIQKRLPNIVWGCDTRADCIDMEMAQTMRQAGCIRACIGVESSSNRILKAVKKGETIEQIAHGIKCFQKAKISCAVFIMIGFPTETPEEAQKTVNFAISLKPSSLTLSILTPYPGSEIYEQAKNLNLIPSDVSYSDYYHQSPKMGLMDLDSEKFEILKQHLIKKVDQYNHNLSRRIRQFFLVFSQNPKGALNRMKNYIKSNLGLKK